MNTIMQLRWPRVPAIEILSEQLFDQPILSYVQTLRTELNIFKQPPPLSPADQALVYFDLY